VRRFESEEEKTDGGGRGLRTGQVKGCRHLIGQQINEGNIVGDVPKR
jgi:hypothetical protein